MINISVTINSPKQTVWEKWTNIDDVEKWAFASDDWAAEGIENDVKVGGKFRARNYAKDGSMEFMLEWTYTEVQPNEKLVCVMDDGRKVIVNFSDHKGKTRLDQAFDPETDNPEEMQKQGWQAYLNNFKKFVEST